MTQYQKHFWIRLKNWSIYWILPTLLPKYKKSTNLISKFKNFDVLIWEILDYPKACKTGFLATLCQIKKLAEIGIWSQKNTKNLIRCRVTQKCSWSRDKFLRVLIINRRFFNKTKKKSINSGILPALLDFQVIPETKILILWFF